MRNQWLGMMVVMLCLASLAGADLVESSFTATKDTWICQGSPDQAWGWEATLKVFGGEEYGWTTKTLLLFDVSSLVGRVATEAKVRLWVDSVTVYEWRSDPSMNVRAIETASPWANEYGVTWNSFHSTSTEGAWMDDLQLDRNLGSGYWIELAVSTDLVNGWITGTIPNYGLVSDSGGWWTNEFFLSAREATNAPTLVVSTIPEPMTMGLLLAGGLGVLRHRKR